MNKLILFLLLWLFISDDNKQYVTATIYHAVPEQTNADYLTTASLKKINEKNPQAHRWIAVSRDLEKLGYTFGTKVKVSGAGDMDGVWTVEDRMNKRWTKRIDFLVNTDMKYGKWENVKISILLNLIENDRRPNE